VSDSTADPAGIPTTLAAALQSGSVFATDGTTLQWSEDGPRSHYLWHWTAGNPEPFREKIVLPGSIAAVVGPLVVTDAALALDTRSLRAVKLPAVTWIDQVAGGYATVTTGSGGSSAVALVPVSSIVPAHC
jgi:hypothetical protein